MYTPLLSWQDPWWWSYVWQAAWIDSTAEQLFSTAWTMNNQPQTSQGQVPNICQLKLNSTLADVRRPVFKCWCMKHQIYNRIKPCLSWADCSHPAAQLRAGEGVHSILLLVSELVLSVAKRGVQPGENLLNAFHELVRLVPFLLHQAIEHLLGAFWPRVDQGIRVPKLADSSLKVRVSVDDPILKDIVHFPVALIGLCQHYPLFHCKCESLLTMQSERTLSTSPRLSLAFAATVSILDAAPVLVALISPTLVDRRPRAAMIVAASSLAPVRTCSPPNMDADQLHLERDQFDVWLNWQANADSYQQTASFWQTSHTNNLSSFGRSSLLSSPFLSPILSPVARK